MELLKSEKESKVLKSASSDHFSGTYESNALQDMTLAEETKSRDGFQMKRSLSRASFRQSFRSSRSKLDEFFKSPLEFGKRKRERRDDDTVSLASEDICLDEPKSKRRSSLAKVTSLAALLSPVEPVKKVGHALQKSLSSWSLKPLGGGAAGGRSGGGAVAYRDPQSFSTPPRRRLSTFWHETIDSERLQGLDKSHIDRQEAIFEVLKSEEDLIEDLKMIKTTYVNSMRKLQLMTEVELDKLFGHIDTLIPVHQALIESMRGLRDKEGTIEEIGQAFLNWVPRLECYVAYCAVQVYSRALLDAKKMDPHIKDFLERCQESPFSRHLDLWSFLDVPRSRLVKYPLLLKTIQKYTPMGHIDLELVEKAVAILERIIAEVDNSSGLAKCAFMKSRLEYTSDLQRSRFIGESTMILCDGVLRNGRGTKLYVCLFDKVLLLTRTSTRDGFVNYQIYREPLPVSELVLEDLKDGHAPGGSFKSVFPSAGNTVRDAFRVSLRAPADHCASAHVMHANDSLDKQHWLRCLRAVIPGGHEADCAAPKGTDADQIASFKFQAAKFKKVDAGVVAEMSRLCEKQPRSAVGTEPDELFVGSNARLLVRQAPISMTSIDGNRSGQKNVGLLAGRDRIGKLILGPGESFERSPSVEEEGRSGLACQGEARGELSGCEDRWSLVEEGEEEFEL